MGCVWIWGREGGENRRPQLSEPAPVGDSGGLPTDNHPPQRAVLPPGTPPVGTQDPPHQARGGFQDSLPLQPVSLGFSLELFLDSELMAGLPAQGNRERPSGLKLRPPLVLPVYQAGSALS